MLNAKKSKIILLCNRNNYTINIPDVCTVNSLNILGLTLTCDLKWDAHVSNILKKCSSRMYILRVLKRFCNIDYLIIIYKCLILPLIDYCCPVFIGLNLSCRRQLQTIPDRCHRIIHANNCTCDDFKMLYNRLFKLSKKLFLSASINPNHRLHNFIPQRHLYSNTFIIQFCKTTRRQLSFINYMAYHINLNTY